MEALKIIVGCTVAAILYGIVHDQVATRVCLEYFTVLHPNIFHTTSPTLLGLGWGIYATWPVGVVLGCVFAICARAGPSKKLTFSQLLPLLACLLTVMALAALTAGTLGYFFGTMPVRESYLIRMTPAVRAGIPAAAQHRFVADWWAVGASFASGISGGVISCALVVRRRRRITANLSVVRQGSIR